MADVEGITGDRLKSFIERIETLEEEKREIAEQIKDVFAEAKGEGFDVPTMRELLKLRKMQPHARSEREMLLDVYKAAIGMLDGTPLGDAGMAAEKLRADAKRTGIKTEVRDDNGNVIMAFG